MPAMNFAQPVIYQYFGFYSNGLNPASLILTYCDLTLSWGNAL